MDGLAHRAVSGEVLGWPGDKLLNQARDLPLHPAGFRYSSRQPVRFQELHSGWMAGQSEPPDQPSPPTFPVAAQCLEISSRASAGAVFFARLTPQLACTVRLQAP